MPHSLGLRIAASVGLAGVLLIVLSLVAAGLGWISFDAELADSEIGVGILVAMVTGIGTGAIAQTVAAFELGPEILVGPLLTLIALTVAALVLGDQSASRLVVGALFVAGGQAKLCGVATQITWTLKS